MSKESSNDSSRSVWQLCLVLGCLFIVALVVASCTSGSTNTTASGTGTVSVMLSDPATCQAPNGPFSHVYVTITDVQVNVSSTASATDGSWTDLTPKLSAAPKQVDLLGIPTSQCFLVSLGDSLQLQAGTYQQIRLILASNSAPLPSSVMNACGTASTNNCVVLSDGSVHTLNLSSEAQTGIKIPGSQIASGGFTIAGGQTKDLDIDFNTCESIVQEGNGQYRLKPVLHAGEVSTTSNSINGTVVDAATGKPVAGTVNYALEQKDSGGIDRIVLTGLVAADGTFVICPVTQGNTSVPYDVVIVGTSASGAFYQPSIVTGVSVGSTTGNIKLYLPTTSTTPTLTNNAAALSGMVTSQNGAAPPVGTVADVQLSALETVNSVVYTIPLPPTSTQNSGTLGVETAAAAAPNTCPPGAGTPAGTTDCVSYTLNVPSGAAYWGAWSASGTMLNAPPTTALLANYSVDGIATIGGSPDCSQPEIKNPTTPTALSTTVPYSVTGLNLNFTGCQ